MSTSPIIGRINALLAAKGISKNQFYKDCEISSAAYSLWNTGKTTPRQKNIEKIAEYLKVTTEYLLDGTQDEVVHNDAPPVDDPFTYAMHRHSADLTEMDKETLLKLAAQLAAANRGGAK